MWPRAPAVGSRQTSTQVPSHLRPAHRTPELLAAFLRLLLHLLHKLLHLLDLRHHLHDPVDEHQLHLQDLFTSHFQCFRDDRLQKVLGAALKAFPQFNASIDLANQVIIYKQYCNIGIAVDTSHGLLVPVIRDVDQTSMLFDSCDVLGDMVGVPRARA